MPLLKKFLNKFLNAMSNYKEEEADLGSLFSIIGKGFSKLLMLIRNFFKNIFYFFLSKIKIFHFLINLETRKTKIISFFVFPEKQKTKNLTQILVFLSFFKYFKNYEHFFKKAGLFRQIRFSRKTRNEKRNLSAP